MAQQAPQKTMVRAGITQPHEITQPFADPLPDCDIAVKVLSVQDENPENAAKYSANWMVECEYPDGFITAHQISKTDNGDTLLTMIRNKLRARHGIPHGTPPTEGTHGLNHVAGDLIGTLPAISTLAGTTISFKKVG